MDIALALVAALAFSLGTVLQQREAAKSSQAEAEKAGFLLKLARKPQWLAGIAADAVGFVAQAVALVAGRLAVVQPVLATSVVFSLPISARLEHKRVSRRELAAALAVTAGLGAFLVAGDPKGGREDAEVHAWIISGVVAIVVCALLVVAARKRPPAMRAALLGIAAGILFGLSALLTKATVERFDDGILEVIADWHLYALVVVGYASFAISQASLQTGALAAAVATQMSLDPLVSVALGVFALGERLHDSFLGHVAVLGSLAVMIAGLVFLAASEQREEKTG
jgi:drug/metabolite transporter (DMT)-like permease